MPTARKVPRKKRRFIITPAEMIPIIAMAVIIAVTLASTFVSGMNPERTVASILVILFLAIVVVVLAYLRGRMAKK